MAHFILTLFLCCLRRVTVPNGMRNAMIGSCFDLTSHKRGECEKTLPSLRTHMMCSANLFLSRVHLCVCAVLFGLVSASCCPSFAESRIPWCAGVYVCSYAYLPFCRIFSHAFALLPFECFKHCSAPKEPSHLHHSFGAFDVTLFRLVYSPRSLCTM